MAQDRLTAAELDDLIGARDYREFLNPRNELYRRKEMKTNPPSRKEAIQLMVREPNLIRRPILVQGKQIVVGFDEHAIENL